MKMTRRFALTFSAALLFAASASAGELDRHYLEKFGEIKPASIQKQLSADLSDGDHAICGTPLKHGLRRDWNSLEPETQKVLAKQLTRPTLSGTELTTNSASGRFRIHYTTSGADAPDIAAINSYTGLGLTSASGWATKVAEAFDQVYQAHVTTRGYKAAPTNSGAPYDIYLRSMAAQKLYGTTNSDVRLASPYANSYSSWMEIDSSFTDSIYNPATYDPLQSLQITAAHEYHHSIQYGYNYYFDIWYAEATSTWLEDELYPSVNQLYRYILPWFQQSRLTLAAPESTTTGGGYGRWIFNRYLAERHNPVMIRKTWEQLAGMNSPGSGADIPMAPVLNTVLSSTYSSTLSAEFFGFAKRVYKRDWSDTTDLAKIPPYQPVATYTSYPVNSSNPTTPSVTLPAYSFAYYKFTPASGMSTLNVTVTKTSGIQIALFKKNGSTITEVTPSGSLYSATSLSTSDEVVLLIANSSSNDNHQASFSTDGTGSSVTEPATPTVSTAKSGGCFIATAAYGSYLHPEVQKLRHFRDQYLLTTPPGRAFVGFYYSVSPPLADLIAESELLKWLARLMLAPLLFAVGYPVVAGVMLLFAFVLICISTRRHGGTEQS